MLNFQAITMDKRSELHPLLYAAGRQDCVSTFANMLLWMGGYAEYAILDGFVCVRIRGDHGEFFYFPAGVGDPAAAIERLRQDAAERNIPFRLGGVTEENRAFLEAAFPGKFSFTTNRDHFDHLYPVEQLAELAGKKLQAKRNHINRFAAEHPDWRTEPISEQNLALCRSCAHRWLAKHGDKDAAREFGILEQAMDCMRELELEGLLLLDGNEPLAFSMGNRITEKVFDVNFEKADADVQGSFALVNREMARMVRDRYPQVELLNREEDMGVPGLRKAKESYRPILLEKSRALWVEA